MLVPVRERAAEPAECDHVGMPGGGAEDDRVTASDCEPDAAAGRQVLQPGIMQP